MEMHQSELLRISGWRGFGPTKLEKTAPCQPGKQISFMTYTFLDRAPDGRIYGQWISFPGDSEAFDFEEAQPLGLIHF